VRSGNLFSKRDSAVLDAPEQDRASLREETSGRKRGASVTEMPLRRDYSYANDLTDDEADGFDPEGEFGRRERRPAVRVSFRGGLLPKTLWGKIAAGAGFLLLTGAAIAGMVWVRSYVLHDEHFVVPGAESIQIAGNSHVTRPQLLSVFGEDVDRNIFLIPLAERRTELESLPWVEHATVMRLLPNRVRVAIVERTPVAFVRQGTQISLVDANGVLFDLPDPGGAATAQYSFPVMTGISAGDPLSTRAARMRIYMGFIAALDSGGERISQRLSEVDLSNPEDVKAIVPDASGGADILVHFGEEKFLERYHQFQQHLAEWRAQYPRLASVDMRYERQVVLQMQQGAAVPSNQPAVAADAAPANDAGNVAPVKAEAPKTAATTGHVAPMKAKIAAAKARLAAHAHAKTAARTPPSAQALGAPR